MVVIDRRIRGVPVEEELLELTQHIVAGFREIGHQWPDKIPGDILVGIAELLQIVETRSRRGLEKFTGRAIRFAVRLMGSWQFALQDDVEE